MSMLIPKMDSLSIEVVERIVRLLDHISMCRLASMSVHMREGVHSYCSAHLRYLAKQDSSTEASLAASGWESGNDHDIWKCRCIYLAVGPWYWWIKGRKKQVIVDPDYTGQSESSCAVVNNNLFTSLGTYNNTSMIARTRDRLPQFKEFIDEAVFPKYPNKTSTPSVTNFENTLLVKFTKNMDKNYVIMVYDSESLKKVCDIDVMKTITDKSLKRHLEIPDIKMCKNKIAIHLMFGKSQAVQNITQIWTVDTKSPKKESIFLVKTVTYSFDGLFKDERGLVALNSRYLVKIDQDYKSIGNEKNMIHYQSFNNEKVKENVPVNVSDKNLKIINVWHASMIPGLESILCLGLQTFHPESEFRFCYQNYAQLFDLSTEKVISEKQLTKSGDYNASHLSHISWWADNLAVLVRENKNSASLYTWSPGQSDIMEIRIKLPSGGCDWQFRYFHMDYQGIVIAKVNSRKTAFQCYNYEIEKGKIKTKFEKGKIKTK